MRNQKKLITESGDNVYINDFFDSKANFGIDYVTHITEYTVVDFDGDGNYEIVVNIQYLPESHDFFFLVLHYNGQDVHGYFYGVRQMSELKTDGSFSGSSGAVSQGYCRLSFENDMRN